MKTKAAYWLGSMMVVMAAAPARADDANMKLAQQAQGILKTYCAGCHSGPKPKSGVEDYDVLSHASLVKKRKDMDEKPYSLVAPKDLAKSLLWQRAGVDDTMPPAKIKNRPSDEQKAILKKWIEAGAPAFPATSRRENGDRRGHVALK